MTNLHNQHCNALISVGNGSGIGLVSGWFHSDAFLQEVKKIKATEEGWEIRILLSCIFAWSWFSSKLQQPPQRGLWFVIPIEYNIRVTVSPSVSAKKQKWEKLEENKRKYLAEYTFHVKRS